MPRTSARYANNDPAVAHNRLFNPGLGRREGRNLPYVQQKLSIAHGTAATHVTHIYQKLGIHDRQELLSLIAEGDEREEPHTEPLAR